MCRIGTVQLKSTFIHPRITNARNISLLRILQRPASSISRPFSLCPLLDSPHSYHLILHCQRPDRDPTAYQFRHFILFHFYFFRRHRPDHDGPSTSSFLRMKQGTFPSSSRTHDIKETHLSINQGGPRATPPSVRKRQSLLQLVESIAVGWRL